MDKNGSDSQKKRAFYDLSVAERQTLTGRVKPKIHFPKEIKEVRIIIPVDLTCQIECFLFSHPNKTNKTVFYVPGSASVAFCPEAEGTVCGNMAEIFECQVIAIFHRSSLQNKFPVPFNDVSSVVNYCLDHSEKFGIDPNNIDIAGYSSGGLLAIQICMQTLQKNKQQPFHQLLLISPITNLKDNPDRDYTKDAPFMSASFLQSMVSHYVPSQLSASDPIFSPVQNTSDSFKGFPRVIIVYGGNECIVPDILQFQKLLGQANIAVHAEMLPGETHAFPWERVDYLYKIKDIVRANFSEEKSFDSLKIGNIRLPIVVPPDLCTFGEPPPFNNEIFVVRDIFSVIQMKFAKTIVKGEQVKRCILYGLGGSGKTQLTLFYYWYSTKKYTFRWWFTATQMHSLSQDEELSSLDTEFPNEALNAQYRNLALKIGLVNKEDRIVDCIVKIKEWLERHQNWLIVFDDVSSEAYLKSYLPKTGGDILISSRNQEWQDGINVGRMEENQAITLACRILNNGQSDQSDEKYGDKSIQIRDVVSHLGYLPLAIAQACAFIRVKNIEISEYLRRYKSSITMVLQDRTLPAQTEHAPVWVTWNMSIDETSVMPAALTFLYVCAHLAPDNIPSNIIKCVIVEEVGDQIYQEVIIKINEYSMVLIAEKTGAISMHPLVQEVLRHRCAQDCDKRKIVLNKLLNAVAILPRDSSNILLVNHIQQLINNVKFGKDDLPEGVDKECFVKTYSKLADIQYDMCSPKSLETAQKAEIYAKRCQTKLLTQVYTKRSLVSAYWLEGKNTGIGLLKSKEALNLTLESKDNLEIAKSFYNLGIQYHRQGDLRNAIKYLTDAMNLFHKLQDSNPDPMLKNYEAKAAVMLAYIYIDMEKPDEAANLTDRAEDIWLSLPQKQDKQLLQDVLEQGKAFVIGSRAQIHLLRNERTHSIACFNGVIEICRRRFENHGEHQRIIPQNMVQLSRACSSLAESINYLKEAFRIFFALFSEDNIYIATAYKVTGEIFYQYGEHEIAIKYFVRYLDVVKSSIAQEYYSSHFNVVKVHVCLDKHGGAAALKSQYLPILDRAFLWRLLENYKVATQSYHDQKEDLPNHSFGTTPTLQLTSGIDRDITESKADAAKTNTSKNTGVSYFRDFMFFGAGVAVTLMVQYCRQQQRLSR